MKLKYDKSALKELAIKNDSEVDFNKAFENAKKVHETITSLDYSKQLIKVSIFKRVFVFFISLIVFCIGFGPLGIIAAVIMSTWVLNVSERAHMLKASKWHRLIYARLYFLGFVDRFFERVSKLKSDDLYMPKYLYSSLKELTVEPIYKLKREVETSEVLFCYDIFRYKITHTKTYHSERRSTRYIRVSFDLDLIELDFSFNDLDILIENRNGRRIEGFTIPSGPVYKTSSLEFNDKFRVYAKDTIETARFFTPAIIAIILDFSSSVDFSKILIFHDKLLFFRGGSPIDELMNDKSYIFEFIKDRVNSKKSWSDFYHTEKFLVDVNRLLDVNLK